MGEIINETENSAELEILDDHIGYAEDVPLDLSILDNPETNAKYLSSLMKNSVEFYIALQSGLFNKVLFIDIDKVYQYDKSQGIFFETDLEINSEEDYVVLLLSEIVEIDERRIPVFNTQVTIIELAFLHCLFVNYILMPFYRYKWKGYKNAS